MIFVLHEFKIFTISFLCVALSFFIGFKYAKFAVSKPCGQRDWLLAGTSCALVFGFVLFLILKLLFSLSGSLDIKVRTQEELNYFTSHKHGTWGMLPPFIASTVIGLNAGFRLLAGNSQLPENPEDSNSQAFTWEKMKKILVLLEMCSALLELIAIIKQLKG